MLPLISFPIW